MPNINDAFPSNYIKASDLQGEERTVTISRVEFEEVGRDKDRKAVIYFQNKQKGLILNKTNARKITELSGSAITEEWAGFSIKIYPTETEFGGETVECIRIKSAGPKPAMRMSPTTPPPPPPVSPDVHSAPVYDDDVPF